jgi:hypothetical protein
MSRFVNPAPQFGDLSLDALADGKLYFYETGTNDIKVTYADVNESIPNSQPVLLSGSGVVPNIFYTGSAKVILTSSDDVQLWERDPVTSLEVSSFGAQWDSISVYGNNETVTFNDILYVSIISANQNNNPASDATAWTQFDLLKRWNTNESYKTRDPVIGSDGAIYTSLTSPNEGNDPTDVGDVTWFAVGGGTAAGVFADWDASLAYGVGGKNVITGSDGRYYVSLNPGNQNNDPTTTPLEWTLVRFMRDWNTNESYVLDMLVVYSGLFYISLTSNTASQPDTNPTDWALMSPAIDAADVTATPTAPLTGTDVQAQLDELAGLTYAHNNYLINPLLNINQRSVSGTVALLVGEYGHDRFRAGAGGCTYTFATAGNITTLTITAGTLEQVVEGGSLPTADCVLSWSGTAQGQIDGGGLAVSPVTGATVGGTNTTIEFGTGTLSIPQLERGLLPTSLQYRTETEEKVLCQRYCQSINTDYTFFNSSLSTWRWHTSFMTEMRIAPNTVSISVLNGTVTVNNTYITGIEFQHGAAPSGANVDRALALFEAEL